MKQRINSLLIEQLCPVCINKTLAINQLNYFIPYFGNSEFFIMYCFNCGYRKNEILSLDKKHPKRQSIVVNSVQDLLIKIVKSSNASIIIPGIIKLESSPGSESFVTNIEGLLLRLRGIIEFSKVCQDSVERKTLAERYLKKIDDVIKGNDKIEIIIEDYTGNSSILSKKTKMHKDLVHVSNR